MFLIDKYAMTTLHLFPWTTCGGSETCPSTSRRGVELLRRRPRISTLSLERRVLP